MRLAAVVLAAGQGTRMRSQRPKVLHPLAGEPMVCHVLRVVQELGAAPVVLVMTLVMVLVNAFRGWEPRLEQVAWLALVGLAGTWAVLITGKFWEGRHGDAMVRRFVLLVVGLAIGGAACAAAAQLEVALPRDSKLAIFGRGTPTAFYSPGGQPNAMAFLAVFGTLFALVRWWRQCDPLRPARLSLGSMIATMVLAWLAAELWRFPSTWLMMAAGIMSVAIQLCSPRLGRR